jgi:cytochrome c peroxidase
VKKMTVRLVFLVLVTGLLSGCATHSPAAATNNPESIAIGELGESSRPNPHQVTLGRFLFHDKRLSPKREIACSGCHRLTRFGVDGKPTGIAVGGSRGARRTPSVFNTATHIAQFWAGRVPNAQAQVAEPITNPVKMAASHELVLVETLGRVPRYVELFRLGFPNDDRPISLRNVAEAIEAFERGLVNNSRWDRFAAGDESALTFEEKYGLRVFLQSGCAACHTGPQVGGTMYQQVGLAYPWPNQKDKGPAAGTSSAADRPVLKVPSLKNVAETAPYFHDGATSNLEAAIRMMGHHQLGIELSKHDVSAIAAWMRALTGEIDANYVAAPELPPEG